MAEDESLIQLEITTEPPEYVSYEDEAAVVAVDGEHSQQHSLSEPPLSSDDVKINRDTPPPTNGGMAEEGASEGMPGGGTAEQTAEQPTSQHIPVVIFAHTPPPQVDIQESPNPPAADIAKLDTVVASGEAEVSVEEIAGVTDEKTEDQVPQIDEDQSPLAVPTTDDPMTTSMDGIEELPVDQPKSDAAASVAKEVVKEASGDVPWYAPDAQNVADHQAEVAAAAEAAAAAPPAEDAPTPQPAVEEVEIAAVELMNGAPTEKAAVQEPTAEPAAEVQEPPQTPLRSEPPQTPVATEPPQTPLKSEPPQTPVTTEPPQTPVTTEPPQTPVTTEPPKTPVTTEPPKTPVTPEPPQTPLTPEPPQTPVALEPPKSPVTSEPATAEPLKTPKGGKPSPLTIEKDSPKPTPPQTPKDKSAPVSSSDKPGSPPPSTPKSATSKAGSKAASEVGTPPPTPKSAKGQKPYDERKDSDLPKVTVSPPDKKKKKDKTPEPAKEPTPPPPPPPPAKEPTPPPPKEPTPPPKEPTPPPKEPTPPPKEPTPPPKEPTPPPKKPTPPPEPEPVAAAAEVAVEEVVLATAAEVQEKSHEPEEFRVPESIKERLETAANAAIELNFTGYEPSLPDGVKQQLKNVSNAVNELNFSEFVPGLPDSVKEKLNKVAETAGELNFSEFVPPLPDSVKQRLDMISKAVNELNTSGDELHLPDSVKQRLDNFTSSVKELNFTDYVPSVPDRVKLQMSRATEPTSSPARAPVPVSVKETRRVSPPPARQRSPPPVRAQAARQTEVSYAPINHSVIGTTPDPPRLPRYTSFSSAAPPDPVFTTQHLPRAAIKSYTPATQVAPYRSDSSYHRPTSDYVSTFDNTVRVSGFNQNLYTMDRYVQRSRSRTRQSTRPARRDASAPSRTYTDSYSTPALSRSSSIATRDGSFANFYEYAAQKNALSRQSSRSSVYQPLSTYTSRSSFHGGGDSDYTYTSRMLPAVNYSSSYSTYSAYSRPSTYTQYSTPSYSSAHYDTLGIRAARNTSSSSIGSGYRRMQPQTHWSNTYTVADYRTPRYTSNYHSPSNTAGSTYYSKYRLMGYY